MGVTGFDHSPRMVHICRERVGQGDFRVHDLADHIDWLPDACIDLVLFALALEYIDDRVAPSVWITTDAGDGSVPVWFSAASGVVGFVVAMRKPRNPLAWIMLAVAGLWALSGDASFYVFAGILAIPACLGVAILRFRLAAGPAGPVLMNNHD
jgi:hypothetical protein